MEIKQRVQWDGVPAIDHNPIHLRAYKDLIKRGVIREECINKPLIEEYWQGTQKKHRICYETKIEYLIPMHNLSNLPSPHYMRWRYDGEEIKLRSDDAERAWLIPMINEQIAFSFIFKFLQDRNGNTISE